MALWDDERAQPVQIGFILVFAILVVTFAVYQAVLVPQQNAQVEFSHYQQVGQDVTDLRNDLIDAAGSENTRAASVTLGTTYPARVLALNPAPPSGTLETTGEGDVNVTGLSGTSAADLCATNASGVQSRSLVYRPAYNEYGAADNVTYENSVVVRSFQDGKRYGTQSLVENASENGTNRINLRLLTNEFSESGTGTASVDLVPNRTYEETFSPGSNFNVTVPSEIPPGEWRTEILDVDNSTVVEAVGDASGRVEFEFNHSDGDYTISCAPVGLNEPGAYQPPETTDDDIDNPPTASIDGLEDNSETMTIPPGAEGAEYAIQWNATDDKRLDSVEIQLRDAGGNVVDSATPGVGNTTDSGTATVRLDGGDEARYVIKVVVTDSDGQTDTESVTDYADGDSL